MVPARPRAGTGGFTVLEAAISGAIILLFLTSLFALNSNMMHLLECASEAANASQDLQQRVEQVRLSDWQQISNPTWVQANFFITNESAVNLPGMKETITVAPYCPPSATPSNNSPGSFTVTHASNGAVTLSPAGYGPTTLLSQQMLQVSVTITWPSWNRSQSRALSTLISQWGISK